MSQGASGDTPHVHAHASVDVQEPRAKQAHVRAPIDPFRSRLNAKRGEWRQKQEAEAAGLPVRTIAAYSSPDESYTVPLLHGLSSDVVRIRVPVGVVRNHSRLLARDLKEAIAQQGFGNKFVFNLLYSNFDPQSNISDSAEEASAAQEPPVVLKNMELLRLELRPGEAEVESIDEPGAAESMKVGSLRLVYRVEPLIFETHDNGRRPFSVAVTKDSVAVYLNCDPRNEGYAKHAVDSDVEQPTLDGTPVRLPRGEPLLCEFSGCAKVFIGVSSGSSWCDHEVNWNGSYGNSMLIYMKPQDKRRSSATLPSVLPGPAENLPNWRPNYQDVAEPSQRIFVERLLTQGYCCKGEISSNSGSRDSASARWEVSEPFYVHIGSEMHAFQPPDGSDADDVVEYYSKIGRSDVPYPVAVGREFFYFFLDRVCVARSVMGGPEAEAAWLGDSEVVLEHDAPRWEDLYHWFQFERSKETRELDIGFRRFELLTDRIGMCWR